MLPAPFCLSSMLFSSLLITPFCLSYATPSLSLLHCCYLPLHFVYSFFFFLFGIYFWSWPFASGLVFTICLSFLFGMELKEHVGEGTRSCGWIWIVVATIVQNETEIWCLLCRVYPQCEVWTLYIQRTSEVYLPTWSSYFRTWEVSCVQVVEFIITVYTKYYLSSKKKLMKGMSIISSVPDKGKPI